MDSGTIKSTKVHPVINSDSVQLVLSTKGTHQSIVDMMFAKASAFLSKTNIQDQ